MTHLLPRLLGRSSTMRLLACALVLSVAGTGCATYRPYNLPAEYAAAERVDLDTLNLSGLAGATNTREVICWGDVLDVEVDAGLPTLQPRVSRIRVAQDGTIMVPLIGPVVVAGLEVERAEAAIAAAARQREIYPNPFVSVRVSDARNTTVTVVGAVEKPGTYQLPRGSSSLMAAVVSSGGFSEKASGEVEIRHTDPRLGSAGAIAANTSAGGYPTQLASHQAPMGSGGEVQRVNLVEAAATGTGNVDLREGDVVNVVARDLPPIHVLGLVMKPCAVEVSSKRDMYLLDALATAGGCSSQLADRVTIRRRVAGRAEPVTIVASIRKAMDGQENVLLAPGDTVMVRQTPATFVEEVFKSFVRLSFGSSVALF